MNKKNCTLMVVSNRRSGLVLLVVLGMLALFSLLAISYLTISGQSRSASQALMRAKLQTIPLDDIERTVSRKILSGDFSNQSAYYGHSLLEDIYGRDAIEGQFNPAAGSAVLNTPGSLGILKVQLSSDIIINPDPYRVPNFYNTPGTENADERSFFSQLSVENDTYTGRVITFLEGPLANQSYHILGYWGFPGTPNPSPPPATNTSMEFSIAIDLSETQGDIFEATITRAGNKVTLSKSPQEWLQYNSNNPNIFTSDNGVGYRYLINDLPFNGMGYGVERDQDWPTYGNLDQSRLVPGTQVMGTNYQPGFESFPIALLPNFDYLTSNSTTKSLGQSRINSRPNLPFDMVGGTNEGSDAPDVHDFWLAYLPEPAAGGPLRQGEIIPSYHRPEVVNYIAQYYASLGSMTPVQIVRMVQLIDYACARPLSYHLRNCPTPNGFRGNPTEIKSNLDFSGRNDALAIPTLDIDFSVSNGIPELQQWVKALVGGGNAAAADVFAWDLDNDGDGVADSIWVDPNLPLMTSPEGKHLKALAATLIIDLDGRLNINAAGDPYQRGLRDGTNSYQTTAETGSDTGFIRNALGSKFQPQGIGYGPAEISLDRLFGQAMPSFLDVRYGDDRDPMNNLFHVPKKYGQERLGQFFQQREIRFDSSGIHMV